MEILPESVPEKRRATEKERLWNREFKQRQHKTSRGRKHGFKLDQDFLAGQRKSISRKGLDLNDEKVKSRIRRRATPGAGTYISGQVQDINTLFEADTGAAVSVPALSVYNKMEEASRPHLVKSMVLLGARGEPIVEMGKAMLKVQLGNLKL